MSRAVGRLLQCEISSVTILPLCVGSSVLTKGLAGTGKEANNHENIKSDRGRYGRVRRFWL